MNYRTDIEQNTEEWVIEKLGKFSASTADDLLSKPVKVGKCPVHGKATKKDAENYSCGCEFLYRETEGLNKLIKKIAEERFTGRSCEGRWGGNSFTDRGLGYEATAIEDYELRTLNKVHRIGLVEYDETTVCSPDGLIEDDGVIQIKCPIFSTQLDYLELNEVPERYYKQMQFELFVTGRQYNMFYSFHPELCPVMIRVEKNEEMMNEIKIALVNAEKRVQEILSKIIRRIN